MKLPEIKQGKQSDSEAWDDVMVVPGFSADCEPILHAENIANGCGGFFLCRGGDMGIGVQSEAGREVAQHTGDRLDVHSVLENDDRGDREI